jgi:hypothetical protein
MRPDITSDAALPRGPASHHAAGDVQRHHAVGREWGDQRRHLAIEGLP